jgi:tellurite resistance protein
MIIIGEMNLTLRKATGQFFCPLCNETRSFVHRRVKRFITLYFVPVLPIATVSEHIRCEHCKQVLPLESLNKSPADYQRERQLEFANDVRRVMVLTMLADGQVQPAEIAAVQNVYRRLCGDELSEQELRYDIEQAGRSKVNAAQYARAVSVRRNEEEKEWILRGAFLVASANGPLSPARLDVLKGLPAALNVSEERFRQVISESA